jgi:hypothetical protein
MRDHACGRLVRGEWAMSAELWVVEQLGPRVIVCSVLVIPLYPAFASFPTARGKSLSTPDFLCSDFDGKHTAHGVIW